MPQVHLRSKAGTTHDNDLVVDVKDVTFDYLMTSTSPEIRVSAYLDRDWPEVAAKYEELYVNETCQFESKIIKVIPGSRTRKDIVLPGAMQKDEQLVVIVRRTPLS